MYTYYSANALSGTPSYMICGYTTEATLLVQTVTSMPLANITNSFIFTFISVHFKNLRRNYYLKLLVVVAEIKSVFYTLLKVLIKYGYIYCLLAQDLITHIGVSYSWYRRHRKESHGWYGGDPYM